MTRILQAPFAGITLEVLSGSILREGLAALRTRCGEPRFLPRRGMPAPVKGTVLPLYRLWRIPDGIEFDFSLTLPVLGEQGVARTRLHLALGPFYHLAVPGVAGVPVSSVGGDVLPWPNGDALLVRNSFVSDMFHFGYDDRNHPVFLGGVYDRDGTPITPEAMAAHEAVPANMNGMVGGGMAGYGRYREGAAPLA